MTMNGGPVLDSVKMLACMLWGLYHYLQWMEFNRNVPLVVGSRAEVGVVPNSGMRLG